MPPPNPIWIWPPIGIIPTPTPPTAPGRGKSPPPINIIVPIGVSINPGGSTNYPIGGPGATAGGSGSIKPPPYFWSTGAPSNIVCVTQGSFFWQYDSGAGTITFSVGVSTLPGRVGDSPGVIYTLSNNDYGFAGGGTIFEGGATQYIDVSDFASSLPIVATAACGRTYEDWANGAYTANFTIYSG
jgi:hypothetical protein